MVFDVKQDLCRKACFVANGNQTTPLKDSVYSSVATLRSMRLVAFLAEHNDLHLMSADIGNAYLEARTKEKVCFTAGPEFGELAGHTMIIDKALYGLRSSGARYREKFADTLGALGSVPSKGDPDVWLRDAGDCYEYICVYVDDILVAMKDPDEFMSRLQSDPWNYKLTGLTEPSYHLGADFFRDKDGTLSMGCQTYVNRMIASYKQIFGELPKKVFAPLEEKDHPELDTSEFCDDDGIVKFQSLIGEMQWCISLCRFDIAQAVMTLGRFRAQPRIGHLDRARRIVGYLSKFKHGAIRFRTGIPNHEKEFGIPPTYDWMHSVYGNPTEDIDPSAPPPKGKLVRTTTFKDANLMHCFVTGRSVTGILHMLNQTPLDWFTKRQSQVETATYGSEFMAARQAVEQIMDLRYTLRSMGVPLDGPAWLFGDNKSVVTSSTIPHSTLSKRWNALSYHRCREAIATGIVLFVHLPGTENPSDCLTKSLPHHVTRYFYEPLLFWKGETDVPDPAAVGMDQRGVTDGSDPGHTGSVPGATGSLGPMIYE